MSSTSQVFFSNSSDALLHILHSQLIQNQSSSPASRTVVITPNQLIKKNVQKQLLDISPNGVVTGILFLEFAPALIKLFRSVLGRDPYIPSKGLLSMKLEKILEKYNDDPRVRSYLIQNPKIRIAPFAEQLASLFLEYGKTGRIDNQFKQTWQGKLFEYVFEHCDYPLSLVSLPFQKPKVPYSLHFFGFHHIPSVYHRFFKRLEEYFEISFYQLSPTPEYWGDQTKFLDCDAAHPILQSYGTLLRKTADIITDYNYEISNVFIKEKKSTALERLRDSIAHVKPEKIEADDSIQLHATSSLSRGIEVAYHSIASMVTKGEAQTEDFLLLFNNLEEALPDIHTTFGSVEAPLPYQIYDIPSHVTDSIFSTFQHFISLITGRVSLDQLSLLFEKKEIQEHFELSAGDVHQLEEWLKKLHFRWGISRKHRAFFLEEPESLGTLESILHTLSYSFMKPQLKDSIEANTFSPIILETTDLPLLNTLYIIKEALEKFSTWFHKNDSMTLGVWKKEIFQLIADLFNKAACAEQLYRFCEGLFEYIEEDVEYSAQSIFRFIERTLEKKKGIYGASIINGILCAPLHPETIFSKKYIFVFGLEEGSFPKTEKKNPLEVKQMVLEYTPSRIDEGAAALLSCIMQTQSNLVLQYTYKNPEDGKPQELSSLVLPLIDMLDLPIRHHTSTRFLDPISPMLASTYRMAQAHTAFVEEELFDPAFYEKTLPEVVEYQNEWDIGHIRRFLSHPLKAYTQCTLGMYLEQDDRDYEEKEFTLHPLDKFLLTKEYNVTQAEALGFLPSGSLKKFHKEQFLRNEAQVNTLLEKMHVKQLYTVHFRDDCYEETFLNEKIYLSPSLSIPQIKFHGHLSNVADEMLFIFDTSTNALKFWGDILAFSLWKPNGKVYFVSNDTLFDVPDKGIKELIEYLQIAQIIPSPLLPSFFSAFFENDQDAFEKKLQQALRGFHFEDVYLARFFTRQNTSALLEKWHGIVRDSFTPLRSWLSHARV